MTKELEKSVPFNIHQTANKLINKLNYLLQTYDIATEQRTALLMIKYEPDINQSKIANALGKDKTTISRTIATLEKKGLLSKRQINIKTNLLELTPKGEEILVDSSETVKNYRKNIISGIEEKEIEQLLTLLEKISLNVDKY
jgi:DNA-binding MarR family transcriptional regulator